MKKIDEFIFNLGLETVADVLHIHPKSGSDWSIKILLTKYHNFINQEIEDIFDDISDKNKTIIEAYLIEKLDKLKK